MKKLIFAALVALAVLTLNHASLLACGPECPTAKGAEVDKSADAQSQTPSTE